MQSWTATTRHIVTGKRSTETLMHTGNMFRKNLKLKSKSLELKSKVVLLFSHGIILVFLLLTSNIHQKNCKTVARLSITHTSFKSFNGIQNGVKKTLM